MTTKKLKLVPAAKAKGRTVLSQPSETENPIMLAGDGATDPTYVCGSCGNALLIGIPPEAIENTLLRCKCGAYNDEPT